MYLSVAVPLRAPELSLTSRSPTDVLISWLPIPSKFCRGKIILYRLSFRMSTESSVQVLELPGTTHEYFLEGLKPDSVYLVRISASTKVGWGESSAWTSHQTPKASSIRGKWALNSIFQLLKDIRFCKSYCWNFLCFHLPLLA